MRTLCLLIGLVLLALLIAGIAYSQLQQPPPSTIKHIDTPQTYTQSINQKANEDKLGTESSPLIIKTLDTPESKTSAAQAAKHQDEETTNSRRLILITICIFIAAMLQWGVMIWQARQLKRSVDVLAVSESAFLYTVVPYINDILEKPIRQFIDSLNIKSMGDDDIVDQPYINYWLRNYGKSPAIVKEISHCLIWRKNLSDNPSYNPVELVLDEQMIAAGDSTKQITCNPAGVLKVKAIKEIIDGKSFFWFYGRVIYDDIFGNRHEHRFVWQYTNITKQFRPYYENKEYNKNT